MSRVTIVVAVVAGLVVLLLLAVVVLAAVGASRSRSLYAAEERSMLERARGGRPARVDPAALAGLPLPVQSYLSRTAAARSPGFRVARLRQTGALRTGNDQPWMPFEAEQLYTIDPPGFIWLAKAKVAPLVDIWARDRFLDAQGNMLIRMLGVFTMADGKGPEFDLGAGLRLWGELVSFPETVLDPHVTWAPVDDRHARMIVQQGELKMEGLVDFDEQSLPVAFHAMRYRDVGGKGVLTRWSGHSTDWRDFDGRLFPSHWASVWHLDRGDLEAVRIDVSEVRTE